MLNHNTNCNFPDLSSGESDQINRDIPDFPRLTNEEYCKISKFIKENNLVKNSEATKATVKIEIEKLISIRT